MFRTNAYQESNYPDVTILDNSHKDGMRGRKLRYINGGILRGIKICRQVPTPGTLRLTGVPNERLGVSRSRLALAVIIAKLIGRIRGDSHEKHSLWRSLL